MDSDDDDFAVGGSLAREMATSRKARKHYTEVMNQMMADEAARKKKEKIEEETRKKSCGGKHKHGKGGVHFGHYCWSMCISFSLLYLESAKSRESPSEHFKQTTLNDSLCIPMRWLALIATLFALSQRSKAIHRAITHCHETLLSASSQWGRSKPSFFRGRSEHEAKERNRKEATMLSDVRRSVVHYTQWMASVAAGLLLLAIGAVRTLGIFAAVYLIGAWYSMFCVLVAPCIPWLPSTIAFEWAYWCIFAGCVRQLSLTSRSTR